MRSGAFGRMVAALLLLTVAACGGIRGAPEPPIANFETYLIGLQQPYSPEAVTACLQTPLVSPQATICRDNIVQPLMVAIDLRYEQFELGFFDANRQLDFGSNLAIIGLGTAGAFVSGGTSQILSGVSAAVAGTREAFTKTILAEQTSLALLTAMRAQRDQARAQISSRLRLSASDYPLAMALADVSGYYRAGTIVGALTGVTEAVSIERVQARQNLQEAIHNPEFVPAVPGSGVAPAGVPTVGVPPPPPPPVVLPPPPPVQPGGQGQSVLPPNRPAFIAAIRSLKFNGKVLTPASRAVVDSCAAPFGIPPGTPLQDLSRRTDASLNAMTDCIKKGSGGL
ncbi:MAG: hypothetical protein AB7H71_09670 [Alphaproteobacteria bacterium]